MRHVYTLIAAMYVVPSSWLLLAFGQDRSAQVFAEARAGGAFDTGDFVPPVICLAGAGLLLGLFATLRFSPLGVVLTGSGWRPATWRCWSIPTACRPVSAGPVGGGPRRRRTTPLRTGRPCCSALLMVAAVSVGRWRRGPVGAEPEQRVLLEATVTREQPPEQQQPDQTQDEPSDAGQSYPCESFPVPVPEPEPVTRQAGTPRSGNRFPHSSGSGSNSTDRWAGSSRSTWPYAQRPRDRSLDG